MARSEDGRIDTWAAIGAHIGRDARTAQRYHLNRGLPVHRVTRVKGSTVYALTNELDAWLARSRSESGLASDAPSGAPQPEPVTTASKRGAARKAMAPAVLAAVCGTAFLLIAGLSIVHQPFRGAPVAATTEAQRLYQEGVYACQRRTAAGLTAAIDRFTQIIVLEPNYAPAYVGLAEAYNLAPELSVLAPEQAYPRAKAAALRAIALDPRSAAAHRVLGFVDFWWEHDVSGGYREFETSLKIDPTAPQTHHWFATALAARGDPRALGEIERATGDGNATAAMADRGYVLMMLGRYADARRVLDEVLSLDPAYEPAHDYLSDLGERTGDVDLMLHERRLAAELAKDTSRIAFFDAAERALRARGERAALRTLASPLDRSTTSRSVIWSAAVAAAMLHDRGNVLASLNQLSALNDPSIMVLTHEPSFSWLLHDQDFLSLQPKRAVPDAP